MNLDTSVTKFGLHAFITAGMAFCTSCSYASPYTYIDLGANGGLSAAFAINNSNQIVGVIDSVIPNIEHAALWSNGGITDLGATLTPYTRSTASDINNRGDVIGNTVSAEGIHGVLWSADSRNSPTLLSGDSTYAYGINASGQIAGVTVTTDSIWKATMWSTSGPSTLNPLKLDYSYVGGINNAGQVVGNSAVSGVTDGDGVHAALWNQSNPTDLGTLGTWSEAHAVNDQGQIVGNSYSTTTGAIRAFLWNGTSMEELPTISGPYIHANAKSLNNFGQIVGEAYTEGNYYSRAVLWSDGIAIDLNTYLDPALINSGWVLRRANDINDNGSIVGVAYNQITGASHAFLFVASIPEVSTTHQTAIGLLFLAFVIRKRPPKKASSSTARERTSCLLAHFNDS